MKNKNNLIEISNLYEALKRAPFDAVVGIRIVLLTGTEMFSLFGAEIAPGKRVGAHYHTKGSEIYQIIEGEGIMLLGKRHGERVIWDEPFNVSRGDCFTVDEGLIHQLINTVNEPLRVIFGCARSHLSEDRIVVDGFEGEI